MLPERKTAKNGYRFLQGQPLLSHVALQSQTVQVWPKFLPKLLSPSAWYQRSSTNFWLPVYILFPQIAQNSSKICVLTSGWYLSSFLCRNLSWPQVDLYQPLWLKSIHQKLKSKAVRKGRAQRSADSDEHPQVRMGQSSANTRWKHSLYTAGPLTGREGNWTLRAFCLAYLPTL